MAIWALAVALLLLQFCRPSDAILYCCTGSVQAVDAPTMPTNQGTCALAELHHATSPLCTCVALWTRYPFCDVQVTASVVVNLLTSNPPIYIALNSFTGAPRGCARECVTSQHRHERKHCTL
jgi:hypothetical protein